MDKLETLIRHLKEIQNEHPDTNVQFEFVDGAPFEANDPLIRDMYLKRVTADVDENGAWWCCLRFTTWTSELP